ncbi:hypothetical protein TcasGA2_TC005456 [Tribolium castaneum]|uniref:Uncharacterized protein n=1 Tax=Tribolium castaneum TaxID=7070 RepID=D6WYG0_TRICA|nr:hypothetical protein TcasGA2_TC005456 [Tribolium castaneum]
MRLQSPFDKLPTSNFKALLNFIVTRRWKNGNIAPTANRSLSFAIKFKAVKYRCRKTYVTRSFVLMRAQKSTHHQVVITGRPLCEQNSRCFCLFCRSLSL